MAARFHVYLAHHHLPSFVTYWLGIIVEPAKIIPQIGQEKSSRPGLFATLLYALLYMITELVLIGRALPLSSPPILPIPTQTYYSWQFFFTIPVTLAAWVLLSEIAYRCATQWFGGAGARRQYRNLLGYTFHVPFTLTLWVAETCTALFWPQLWGNPAAPEAIVGQAIWQMLLWVGLIWSILLSGRAIKEVSGLTWFKSLVIAPIAIAFTIGFYVIFIR